MDTDYEDDIPLSESSVSLRLAQIQKRCNELMREPGALEDLTLEDDSTLVVQNPCDPYNHG